ncbi:MAG: penicillin acylase family protein [Candidatus Binatia bacterium]|nr:penicillin acylase family protein [Candidatus Binatia bacterium]
MRNLSGLFWLGAVVTVLAGCSGSNSDEPPMRAEIVRTSFGIPHIKADNFKGLGYGYGYAFSQDNYCELMKEVVRANGRSALFLGDEGNFDADVVYSFFNNDEYIENEFMAAAPRDLDDLVVGYAAGMNRYLRETGAEGLPEGETGCREAAYVREVTPMDLAKVYRKLILRGSMDPLIRAVTSAAPPESLAAAPRVEAQSFAFQAEDLGFIPPSEFGSNAYAIGRDASRSGKGLLFGNPHFPWNGPQRFYNVHLEIPGVYNVAGASLFGVPLVNIGFNEDLAWTHTVSTARRFAFVELRILPTDPMRYQYDDEVREITSHPVTVEVRLEDGSVEERTKTIYMSHVGPIVDLGVLSPVVAGWPTAFGTLLALRDANLENTAALPQWLAIGQSHSIAELLEALELLGVPWVNTIAADRDGQALYGDVGAIPNISVAKLDECGKTPLTELLTSQGFPSLDGSRSACEWGVSPGVREGLFAADQLPALQNTTYVANANDSYWLSNPAQLLTDYSPVIGREDVAQSFRTRLTFMQAEERIAGTDGLGLPGFDRELLEQMLYLNRNIGADLVLDDVIEICSGVDDWPAYSNAPAQAAEACEVLSLWDTRYNSDSTGPHIWEEFWGRLTDVADVWAVPFDVTDPVHTPRELNRSNLDVVEGVKRALGEAVDELIVRGLPMNRSWGEVQYKEVDGDRIPISGGSGASMFSVISSRYVGDQGRGYIRHGNSYIQVVTWDDSRCPDASSVLTYSQSTNPASPHFADMTRVYSAKEWVDMPFCADDIEADTVSEIVLEAVAEPLS